MRDLPAAGSAPRADSNGEGAGLAGIFGSEEGEMGGEGVDVEERVRLRVVTDLERRVVELGSRRVWEDLDAWLFSAGDEAVCV